MERPILFSAPMVRAILEGRKTQTRRVMKVQPKLHDFGTGGMKWAIVAPQTNLGYKAVGCDVIKAGDTAYAKMPYGQPGDRLWVRETFGVWRKTSFEYDEFEVGKEATRGLTLAEHEPIYGHSDLRIAYRSDADDEGPWYPSIHMPRWASRITLEVTDVRVQRLQDISEEDAIAEGVEPWVIGTGWREYGLKAEDEAVCGPPMPTAKDSFRTLWDSINAKSHPWSGNPWVWAISFTRVK